MRLAGGGLIDRGLPLRFRFDGRDIDAYQGDTVASALIAAGVRMVGRSFKYHRPRGIVTAGSEEPNALVTVGEGAAREPNVRATVQEVFNGLEVRSQNAWPSLRWDAMSVNDALAPMLAAGFYYKTFMWPRAFWEGLYEPVIRRAAGLGALSGEADPGRSETAFAFCDLLVIGGGPAGLMAALTAAEAGADVILADEDDRMGGRLLAVREEVDGKPGAEWAKGAVTRLAAMPNVRLMTRTTVTGAYDQGTFGALERVQRHRAQGLRDCFWRIAAKQAVLCAGALERGIAFPDNDRPGIMMAGAVQAYANRWAALPGQRVVLFGNNDSLYDVASDLVDAGADPAVYDSRAEPERAAEGQPFAVHAGAQVVGTTGRRGLERVRIATVRGLREVRADCLCVSGGWNPAVHLTCHMNGRPVWDEAIQSFIPQEDAIPGMRVAGAAGGVFSTAGCLASGFEAAKGALDALAKRVVPVAVPRARDGHYRISPLWVVEGPGRAWLDQQNDVTVKDVRLAAQENFTSVEHMKRYTTQGMAPDQGKGSNVLALAVLADATGRGIPETGTTTFRPPYVPVPIAAMGAGGRGHGFAPERFTTSHRASVARGAPMIEAGLWYRPSYFPVAGETTWRESCDREVRMVREAVGICDVSTLGKIDVQGPDAAAFLDFLYCNLMSEVGAGRVRYGLMLREDGFVMDDGTCARLGEGHYLVTTTTAAAGQVMRYMEFAAQVLRPDLNVRFASVTDQWAQFAVAGPRSREVLESLTGPVDLPFMACAPVEMCGVAGRLFRISFSGEHSYEIAVPSRYGDALFRLLVAQSEGLGGGAYGMEALNVLRIEKGFLTHAELHGRTTAFDLGLGRMVSDKKECIGKVMAARPGLNGPEREHLVGLRPLAEDGRLLAGAHLFAEGAEAIRENSAGYVTSAGYSPTFGHDLALGFLADGRARHGEVIEMVDHLRDVRTVCEVTGPVFFDPEGGRMRG
ncbi:sarcosine oxidase subunit alpha family protein [Aestuariibius insulae]|uniref:sarcosine oxidase subunit alpha family protein n=1 Tax=Aestuariibius insulae TaxID=2058287 RepID=UPI00345EBD8E